MTDAYTTDVLVLGSGIAGCATALAAAREGAEVLVATKAERPEDAATDWAQGGIATTRDDPESFKGDVLAASDDTADPEAVDVLVEDAADAVEDVLLDTLSIPFDETGDGDLDYAREAAHSERRILHVDAATGKHILRPFLNYLDEERDDVTILEDTAGLELIGHEGRVHGAMLDRRVETDSGAVLAGDRARTGEPVYAGATVLATGGVGALYQRSTNPRGATGDGVGMATLAGADVADMEYVQFHPTALDPDNVPGADEDDVFLLSEAVRGEGAVLRNGDVSGSDDPEARETESPGGERFMPSVHEDAELAPRDVVARAVERERSRTGRVDLDVSGIDFEASFPGLAERCRAVGVDPDDGIPVAPCEHFLCGGVDVDGEGRTSLDRLFAVGECARTGVHGANRLASTSLLEGLVWGLRAGEAAAGFEADVVEAPDLLDRDPDLPERFAAEKFTRLRRVMSESAGLVRDPEDLARAGGVLRRLKGEVDAYVRTRTDRSLYELRHAAVTALLIARAAADNPESAGCHYVERSAPAEAD